MLRLLSIFFSLFFILSSGILHLHGSQNEISPPVNSRVITPRKPHKFIIITPPKCGTYLLSKAVRLICQRPHQHYKDYFLNDLEALFTTLRNHEQSGKYIVSHLPPDRNLIRYLLDNDYRILTIIRDPRDQLLSAIHWIIDNRDPDHLFDVPVKQFKALSFNEQIDELITGERFGFKEFEVLYQRHYQWLELDPLKSLVVKFEDLVGPKGGGNRRKQIECLLTIARKIGVPLSKERAAHIADEELFGTSATFRSGQIEEWKEVFTREQKLLFNALYGPDLLYLGYPLYEDNP